MSASFSVPLPPSTAGSCVLLRLLSGLLLRLLRSPLLRLLRGLLLGLLCSPLLRLLSGLLLGLLRSPLLRLLRGLLLGLLRSPLLRLLRGLLLGLLRSPLLGLLRGLLTCRGFGGGAVLGSMVGRRWRSHPRFRSRRRMGGWRRRGWRWSRLRRLMISLRCRDALLRCCRRRRLRGVRRWLRPMLRRRQAGEVGRTRRMSCRGRRCRRRRPMRRRRLRRRLPGFGRSRDGGDVPGATCAGGGGACGPTRAGARCEKSGAPGGWPGAGAGGVALAAAGGAGAVADGGWAPAAGACPPGGVAGDFRGTSAIGLTRGAGASSEKFGRAGGCTAPGPAGLD